MTTEPKEGISLYHKEESGELWIGDCLALMKTMPDKSVDAIICDLPYGTTACSWDTVIPFEPLWEQYKRIIKDNGAIVLFGSQPFTTDLINSNRKWFKYEWIWDKNVGGGFLNANRNPLKSHENICIFYQIQPVFNPQKWKGKVNHAHGKFKPTKNSLYGDYNIVDNFDKNNNLKNPLSIIQFDKIHPSVLSHPTQKPLELLKYLVLTYSNEGDTILDNCFGSGTTLRACKDLGRHFIGCELEEKYVKIAKKRLEQEVLF